MIFNSINPVAFTVFGNEIRWYAIILTTAMIIGLIGAILEAKRRKLNSDFVFEIFIVCVPVAVIFARLFYVVFNPTKYFPINNIGDFKELFAIHHGGLTIIGAVFGAMLGGRFVGKRNKMKLVELMDFGFPFLILGQALGRWGNYINQEAFGQVVVNDAFQRFPFAVYIERLNEWHHATFFYEMILNLIGFAVLYTLSRKATKRGLVASFYFVWYGLTRFFMEFLRTDAVTYGTFKFTQFGCIVAALIGLSIFLYIKYSGRGKDTFNLQPHYRLMQSNDFENIQRKNFIK